MMNLENRLFSIEEKWANTYLKITQLLKLADKGIKEVIVFILNEVKQNILSMNA